MAQRMACIVLEEMCRELGRPALTALAATVHVGMAQSFTVDIEKYVDDMLNLGSRYINIEATLGRGICLVLGCELPESHWYKLLPKSGELFDSVMGRLRSVGMEQLSARYVSLRNAIVESRMNLLRGAAHQASVIRLTPQAQQSDCMLMSPGLLYREARREMLGSQSGEYN